jgi:DNA-binding NarL/FixJ family response regulator
MSLRKPKGQAADTATDGEDLKALIAEVRSLKMLLILQTLAEGYQQKQIASALGVSEATLSRMMPRGLANRRWGTES